jgi:hypothetical protein
MPPCGYSGRAVAHMVGGTAECYEDLRREVAAGKHPDFVSGIKKEIKNLRCALEKPQFDGKSAMRGNLQYMLGCYEDLESLIDSGQYPNYEAAIAAQLSKLEHGLAKLHVTDAGDVVERSD